MYSHAPTQADVKTYQAMKTKPTQSKYPYSFRWYQHIASFEHEFSSLPGDPSKEFSAYGPESSQITMNQKAPAATEEDDDEVDLFGSDDEEEDAEAVRVREERLAEYKKKKEGKTKPAARTNVTMDVKPWGEFFALPDHSKYTDAKFLR